MSRAAARIDVVDANSAPERAAGAVLVGRSCRYSWVPLTRRDSPLCILPPHCVTGPQS